MPTLPSAAWWAIAIACATLLVAWTAWWACGVSAALRKVNSRLVEVCHDLRGLRKQQGTMNSMLRRAGYKSGPLLDWSDDQQRTRVMDSADTQWDFRKRE